MAKVQRDRYSEQKEVHKLQVSRTFFFQTKGGRGGVYMRGLSQTGQTTEPRQSQHGQGATGQVLRVEGGPQAAGEQDICLPD